MNAFERGMYSALTWLSSTYHGKQYYFLQDNDMVYSRDSGKYLTIAEAMEEFAKRLEND